MTDGIPIMQLSGSHGFSISRYNDDGGVPEEEHQQQQRPARSLQVVNQTHVDILLLLLGVVIRSVMVCTGTFSGDCILLSTANKNILRRTPGILRRRNYFKGTTAVLIFI